MLLNVDSFVVDTKQVFKLNGVLDYSTVDTFDFFNKTKESVTELEVDFSELDFIDSTGIGAILSILHSASNLNAKVNFVGMSDDTKQLFDTIGVFEIKKSLLGEG
ncbi:STAS domain-containing protein [Ureibacillus sp. GCM10028918]|uniref:STAS domain-containing protein n=1 Tax=Ureibacillus sp. GCM10028918 TaxID=3273429 RepID=UPI003607FB5D